MPHKQSDLVRQVRIDVLRVGLTQAVRQQQTILVAVPFAANPAEIWVAF